MFEKWLIWGTFEDWLIWGTWTFFGLGIFYNACVCLVLYISSRQTRDKME